jgi:beta-mannosidase
MRSGMPPRTTKRVFLQSTAAGATLGLMPDVSRAGPALPATQASLPGAPLEHDVSRGWQFRDAGSDDEWLPATVPGTVHTDLLANGLIKDPFYRTNERDLQWIDKRDWEYRTTLDLDAETVAHEHIELSCAGLDTFADVYFNDVRVLQADNMFRIWTADIKAHAKVGPNTVRVLLRSPIQEGLKKLDALGYDPPAVVDWSEIGGLGDKHVSMFVRKAVGDIVGALHEHRHAVQLDGEAGAAGVGVPDDLERAKARRDRATVRSVGSRKLPDKLIEMRSAEAVRPPQSWL